MGLPGYDHSTPPARYLANEAADRLKVLMFSQATEVNLENQSLKSVVMVVVLNAQLGWVQVQVSQFEFAG